MVVEIPEKLTGPVRYPLVLLKHGEGSPAAQSFHRHLSSPGGGLDGRFEAKRNGRPTEPTRAC